GKGKAGRPRGEVLHWGPGGEEGVLLLRRRRGVHPPGGLPGGGRLPHRGDEAPRGAGGRRLPADGGGGGPLPHGEGVRRVLGLVPARAGAGHGVFALPDRRGAHGGPVVRYRTRKGFTYGIGRGVSAPY